MKHVCVFFYALLKFRERNSRLDVIDQYGKNGTERIDKNRNIIISSLTILGKNDEEISVAITIQPHVDLFSPTDTTESDSAKNMQLKHIRCLLLKVKS